MYSRRDSAELHVGSERTFTGEQLDYLWFAGGLTPFEGAMVIKTDRFGQRWMLLSDRDSDVTVRVAAGLLGVTPMTVTNWLKAGSFPGARTIHKAAVIPLRDIERVARARGYNLPFAEE